MYASELCLFSQDYSTMSPVSLQHKRFNRRVIQLFKAKAIRLTSKWKSTFYFKQIWSHIYNKFINQRNIMTSLERSITEQMTLSRILFCLMQMLFKWAEWMLMWVQSRTDDLDWRCLTSINIYLQMFDTFCFGYFLIFRIIYHSDWSDLRLLFALYDLLRLLIDYLDWSRFDDRWRCHIGIWVDSKVGCTRDDCNPTVSANLNILCRTWFERVYLNHLVWHLPLNRFIVVIY